MLVEARQLTVENLDELEQWCSGSIKGTTLPPEDRAIDLQTPHGEVRALIGDYIIRDANGDFSACAAEEFESAYEAV